MSSAGTTRAPKPAKNIKPQITKPDTGPVKNQPTSEQMRMAQIISDVREETEQIKLINQVIDVTDRTRDEVAIALHDCDNDLTRAIAMLLEGDVAEQGEWRETGKKKKPRPVVPTGSAKETKVDEPVELEIETNNAAAPRQRRTRPPRMQRDWKGREQDENEKNRAERPDRTDRYDRSDRSDRNDRFDRNDRSERSDRFDRNDRSERNDRAERSERPERSDRYRGRGRGFQANGPSRGRGRGGRSFRGSRYSRENDSSIGTWSNETAEKPRPVEEERWDEGNDDWGADEWTGSLNESKVFTPSAPPVADPVTSAVAGGEYFSTTQVFSSSYTPSSEQEVPLRTTSSSSFGQKLDLSMLMASVGQHKQVNTDQQFMSQYNKEATESIKNAMGIGLNSSAGHSVNSAPSGHHMSSTSAGMNSGSLAMNSSAANINSTGMNSPAGLGLNSSSGHNSSSSLGMNQSSLTMNSSTAAYGMNSSSDAVTMPDSFHQMHANSMNKTQRLTKAKLPPPSKIPDSAVEMPSAMNFHLDVQFGNWDSDSSFTSQPSAPSDQNYNTPSSTTSLTNHLGPPPGLSKPPENKLSESPLLENTPAGSLDYSQTNNSLHQQTNNALHQQTNNALHQQTNKESLGFSSPSSSEHKFGSSSPRSKPSFTTYTTSPTYTTYSASTSSYGPPPGYTAPPSTFPAYTTPTYSTQSYAYKSNSFHGSTGFTPQSQQTYSSGNFYPPPPGLGSTKLVDGLAKLSVKENAGLDSVQSYSDGSSLVSSLSTATSTTSSSLASGGVSSSLGSLNSSAGGPTTTAAPVKTIPQLTATTSSKAPVTHQQGMPMGINPNYMIGQPPMPIAAFMNQSLLQNLAQQPLYGYDDSLNNAMLQQRLHQLSGYYDLPFQTATTLGARDQTGMVASAPYAGADGKIGGRVDVQSPVTSTQTQQSAQQFINPTIPPGYYYNYMTPAPYSYQPNLFPMTSVANAAHAGTTGSSHFPKQGAFASHAYSAAGYEDLNSQNDFAKNYGSQNKGSAGASNSVSNAAATADLNNLYGKAHSFHADKTANFAAGTPPPYGLLGGQGQALGGAFAAPYMQMMQPQQTQLLHHHLQQQQLQQSENAGGSSRTSQNVKASKPFNSYWPGNN